MIHLTATLEAKPGHEDTLKQLLLDMVQPTQNEVGCIRYTLLRDKGNSSIFMLQEQFIDQAAFDTHCREPHFLNLLDNLDGLLTKEPSITFFEQL
ncbi:antibiotic biosynthesis monooxygenase [Vibrio sp. OCN044]|uniref:Antibiotic biosynthesis monooxygenase n=1 Tax=Vibrio tetraodonis subsp. pristinus TaxID=2695891 RepID=A0A6L8LTV4_9VIBR|nr:putative quinol monooxygenase [Vibrio tetraodonis]MYM58070.1 antibiotic biosynthesis monooxygenase [Vibrio tetraodonis subsp. pristinus]